MWVDILSSTVAAEIRQHKMVYGDLWITGNHSSHVANVFHCYINHYRKTIQNSKSNDRYVLLVFGLIDKRMDLTFGDCCLMCQ